ncbi:hypothetical protein HOLleu_11127 [Holothuria leucospilota]|uniref:SET domain-containing protein n=1 Tax=Holothuria leucospilota TaxID=206669 RepID=A0A9Q1CG45_HOLLE|nr:hypothetical protein HOLleu_11127 [Holothuria leucospilota]
MVNDEHIVPNCKMVIVVVDKDPHLCLFAAKEIPPFTELRFDYGVKTLPVCQYNVTSTIGTTLRHRFCCNLISWKTMPCCLRFAETLRNISTVQYSICSTTFHFSWLASFSSVRVPVRMRKVNVCSVVVYVTFCTYVSLSIAKQRPTCNLFYSKSKGFLIFFCDHADIKKKLVNTYWVFKRKMQTVGRCGNEVGGKISIYSIPIASIECGFFL